MNDNIIKIYVDLIKQDLWKLKDVPLSWRTDVEKILNQNHK